MAKYFMSPEPRSAQVYGLIGWLAICFLAAAIGATASLQADAFYVELERPDWAPPSWVFGPVWTILYALMAVSAWLAWRVRQARWRRAAIFLFLLQLMFNSLWSWLFFHWRAGALAFLDILLLWALLLLTLALFWRVRPLQLHTR